MVQRRQIILSINDKKVAGKDGDTVLDVCRANNIYVPTLCYLEGLSFVGACRLCVVEIEGERRINPACTYPARDGLVVRTHTPKLEQYRRQMLELIFTERNHFCFFCVASGKCELQTLAYQYQMDHTRYPYTFPTLPVDTLNDYIVIDHNRCILCGRCVRVCGEVVANHTLNFGRRGFRTLVVADLNQSLGESSCISCGACVQACPTGAIFSKVSAYKARGTEGKPVRSVCSLCGVGCGINAVVKDNNIVRIDGANLTGPTGTLCVKGRFQQFTKDSSRITAPLITNKDGTVRTSSWEEALDLVTRAIRDYRRRYGADSIAGVVSSLCPNEAVEAFASLMSQTIGTDRLSTLDNAACRTLSEGIRAFGRNGHGFGIESPLESILDSDCVLVVGADPLVSHPVAGCYVLRAQDQKHAQLVVIDSRQNDLGARADVWLRPAEGDLGALIDALERLMGGKKRSQRQQKLASVGGVDESLVKRAADILKKAQRVAVVYGEGVYNLQDPGLVVRVLELGRLASPHQGLKVISLKPRGNSRGAWELVSTRRSGEEKDMPKLAYILLADDDYLARDWLQQAKQAEFLIVQASYASPLTRAADVVLPSPIWAERGGKYVTLDGKVGQSQPVLEPYPGIKSDAAIIAELARKLKRGRPR